MMNKTDICTPGALQIPCWYRIWKQNSSRLPMLRQLPTTAGNLSAKGLTASLTPEQRITMLDMTVRNAQTAKAEQFHIDLPKNIVPIRTEESLEESMAVGAEHQTVDISLKRIQKNSQKRR